LYGIAILVAAGFNYLQNPIVTFIYDVFDGSYFWVNWTLLALLTPTLYFIFVLIPRKVYNPQYHSGQLKKSTTNIYTTLNAQNV